MVDKGDVVGYISNPAGQTDTILEAPSHGIIIGRTNLPLVYEGEALFHIGRTHETAIVEEQLDAVYGPDSLNAPELVEEPIIV